MMSVSTFVLPNPSTQVVDEYLAVVDGDIAVMSRVAAAFAPHQNEPATLNLVVDAGPIFNGSTVLEVAQQTTSLVAAPVNNPRIDRVVINRTSGQISVINGSESANPVAPPIPQGAAPIARVLISPGQATITNSMITDERAFLSFGSGGAGGVINIQRFTASGTYTPTPGTSSVIVEVIGGGGGGGGSAAAGSTQASAAGGGSAGGFARARLTTGFSGVSVTVGNGGAVSAAASVNGNPGEPSSFGSLVSCPGGVPGFAGTASNGPLFTRRSGGTALPTGGNLVAGCGMTGGVGLVMNPTNACGGAGGPPVYGAGSSGSLNGSGGTVPNPGGGGGGGSSYANNGANAGGAGGPGLVTIYEFA